MCTARGSLDLDKGLIRVYPLLRVKQWISRILQHNRHRPPPPKGTIRTPNQPQIHKFTKNLEIQENSLKNVKIEETLKKFIKEH